MSYTGQGTAAAQTLIWNGTKRTWGGLSITPGAFTPNQAILPTSGGASPAGVFSRNQRAILTFDDTLIESADFASVVDPGFTTGQSIEILVHWISSAAIIGTVEWIILWERLEAGGPDLDVNNFEPPQSASDVTDPVSGVEVVTTISLTQAQAGGVVGGDEYRIRLQRDTGVGGNMVGDAQVTKVASQVA